MDMWLYMKRTINVVKRGKKMYKDGRSKVEAIEAKLAKIRVNLDVAVDAAWEFEEAKQAVEVVLEAAEQSRADEIKAAVKKVITQYRSSEDFTVLLDREVRARMVDLIYRFKCFNLGKKLNLNFLANFPPLPEVLMEDYESEYAPAKKSTKGTTSNVVDAVTDTAV
ncbi:hypothetical protein L3X38_018065 [Prunus dulcis]|uniref:Uncharacterized protein n=1 Tax=Prunus dulcis TaxID=3755 RepID=A0AAD4W8I4_PRUDU|nr:hypothetical protein L3X38_018065 [Prunus dulcis]